MISVKYNDSAHTLARRKYRVPSETATGLLLHLMRHRKFVTFDKAGRKRWKNEGRKFQLIS
jgi:hypothetical protein